MSCGNEPRRQPGEIGMSITTEEEIAAAVASVKKIYMNLHTGSVDTADGWDDADIESGAVVEVVWDTVQECWVVV